MEELSKDKHQAARQMLCRYIQTLAKEKGISQKEIAEKTGFTESNVSRMLAGKYPPTLDNFIKLAEAVNCYFFILDKEADDDLTEMMRKRWKVSDN